MTTHLGITAGAFDLLHPGHLLMLEQASKQCDELIVMLQSNPRIDRPEKGELAETLLERHVRLVACRWVAHIIPYDTERDLLNALHIIPWSKRFLDERYKGAIYTGHDLRPEDHVFLPRQHDWSSTRLRNKLRECHEE